MHEVCPLYQRFGSDEYIFENSKSKGLVFLREASLSIICLLLSQQTSLNTNRCCSILVCSSMLFVRVRRKLCLKALERDFKLFRLSLSLHHF